MGKANKPTRDQRPRYTGRRSPDAHGSMPEEAQRPKAPRNLIRRPIAQPPMERVKGA